MDTKTRTSWYLNSEPRPHARVRLYTLPYAGGGASVFRRWARHLPYWVELRPIRLPGRLGRYKEEPLTDCDTAARMLADVLSAEAATDSLPYALFGHSMGAMLSYRVTRLLHQDGGPLPALLALAAWPVHGVELAVMPDPADSDDRFAATLQSIGGLPPEALRDSTLRAMILPVTRADFRLCRTYRYRLEAPLPVPLAVYGGHGDEVAPPGSLTSWRDQTVNFLGFRWFPGNHFFLREHEADLASSVAADLAAVTGVGGQRER